MASESTVQREVWIELSRRQVAPSTLFRTNSGKAWMSGLGPRGVIRLQGGDILIKAARPIALGMALTNGDTVPGLLDLNGFTRVTITPDMVGRVLPVYTAIETKATGGGRKREDQINMVRRLHAVGAIAGFASSAAQAHEIIDAWLRGETPVPL